MITPQQFLQLFLREKAAVFAEANARLKPLYAESFEEPLSKRAADFLLHDPSSTVIEEVREASGSTTAITRERFRVGDVRMRYHLKAVGDSWKIIRIDHECFLCRRARKNKTVICPKCQGTGWYNPVQTRTDASAPSDY